MAAAASIDYRALFHALPGSNLLLAPMAPCPTTPTSTRACRCCRASKRGPIEEARAGLDQINSYADHIETLLHRLEQAAV